MEKTFKFKPRVSFAPRIRDMKPKSELYFAGASHDSIKAIASRVGASSKPKRIYYTQSEPKGVIVWRET